MKTELKDRKADASEALLTLVSIGEEYLWFRPAKDSKELPAGLMRLIVTHSEDSTGVLLGIRRPDVAALSCEAALSDSAPGFA